jgi:hypothetical protein
MANEATSGAQAEPQVNPQAGAASTSDVTAQVTTTPQAGEAETTIDLSEAKKLRSEASGLRKRLKELEDAATAKANAELSETQRAKKAAEDATAKLTQLEVTLRNERAARAVQAAAIKLNLDPDLAAELVRPDALEYDEAGAPTNVEKALKLVVQRWPHLIRSATQAPNVNAADGRGTVDAGAANAAYLEEIKRRFRLS